MTQSPDTALMMQNLFTSVLWVDSDLCISWANAQSEQLFSASRSRLLGQSILSVLLPIDEPNQHQNNHKNKPQNRSKKAKRKPSNTAKQNTQEQSKLYQQFANAKAYGQPFIDYSKHIMGINHPLYVNYSVTPMLVAGETFFLLELWEKNRQSRLDNERQLQEQHDVARQMLRSVAHEVKNPLAGIRGAAQLLTKHTKNCQKTDSKTDGTQNKPLELSSATESQGKSKNESKTQSTADQLLMRADPSKRPPKRLVEVDAEKITTYANIIIEETDRLTSLIGELLGSNRLPDWQILNVHEPLEHVLVLTHSQHPKIRIERDYDLSLPELKADKNQLIQVFLNLVNNACDAMLEHEVDNPTLTLTTRVAWSYTIGKVRHAKVVKVCVHDNGGGIAPELLGRIFFPLVTGRAGGTGLGLSLVQDIVHRHQGAIEVNSQQGDTEFCVYLPFEQADEA